MSLPAGRFAIKSPNPSGTMSACTLPFSLQGFPVFFSWSCIFITLCSKLLNCEVEFFLPFCLVELLRIYLQLF